MKKKLSLYLSLVFCFSFLFVSGCSPELRPIHIETPSSLAVPAGGLSGKLTLNGSTSMTKVCNALGEAFTEKNPLVTVEKSDTGSGSAIKAVLDGTALIGDLSRKVKESESPEKFSIVTIALDGIAVIVNENNRVTNLSSDQIAKIFTGEIENWSEVGGDDASITLIGREESSGTREGFESILNISGKCQYEAEYPEAGDIVSKVSNDPGAVGYCSLFSVSGAIKAVDVDGVTPREDTIFSGEYPIQRPFVEIFKKNSDSDLIFSWFSFIDSEEGRAIIAKENLVAVPIDQSIFTAS